MNSETRYRLSRAHRLLGMVVTVPLVGWVLSSFVLHGVGLALPNGLQGEYELAPHHPAAVPLDDAGLVPPTDILKALGRAGMTRIYWLRLEALAGVPAYVVKPGPFEMERVFDARTGARMDPLSDAVLRSIADGELVGTRAAALQAGDEFNRYYTLDRVPAVSVQMEGDQPSELVLARASGRVLRRTDPLAAWFNRAYRSVHVWQWGESLRVFTALLYTLVGLALLLVTLGYTLWFDRRAARKRWTSHVRPARRVHAKLALWAGFIVSTQMLVGAYLWFNLGLIEPRFRGQGSFREEWAGGLGVDEALAPANEIAAALPPDVREGRQPIQRYEWRAAGEDRLWLAYPDRGAEAVLMDAGSGGRLDRLTPDQALAAAGGVVLGATTVAPRESSEYWMDANARVPTYLFRFTDPDDTDFHVSQTTGEVIQRRPAIWRAFGPFLAYHTFGFTGNPWLDTALLSVLQITVLAMVFTGWRLALTSGRTRAPEGTAEPPLRPVD
jgi:hypothetical protein